MEPRLEYHLGVAPGPEVYAEALELPSKLAVIVDLAIEDDDCVAVIASHRLFAAIQVDDLQPHRCQRDRVRVIGARLVGSTVTNAVARFAHSRRIGPGSQMCVSGYTAHTGY